MKNKLSISIVSVALLFGGTVLSGKSRCGVAQKIECKTSAECMTDIKKAINIRSYFAYELKAIELMSASDRKEEDSRASLTALSEIYEIVNTGTGPVLFEKGTLTLVKPDIKKDLETTGELAFAIEQENLFRTRTGMPLVNFSIEKETAIKKSAALFKSSHNFDENCTFLSIAPSHLVDIINATDMEFSSND